MHMPFRHRSTILLWILLILFCSPGWASSGAERLEAFLDTLDTLQADFIQTVASTDQGVVRLEGTFYLRRPDQFRWEYREPEPQSIIADGRQIWVYDPDLEQVSVQNQDRALKGTPAMLLIEGGAIQESFDIAESSSDGGLVWFDLTPKDEESQYERIRVGVRNEQLSRLEMKDKLGQMINFHFEAVRPGLVLDDGLFSFEPPAGADLYNQ